MARRKDIEIAPQLQEIAQATNGHGSADLISNAGELRSAEANELLARPPSWLMRWGILSVVGVFFLLFAIAAMIRYPDTIEGNASVTTNPLPIHLKAMNTGRVKQFFLPDNAVVNDNQAIAEIENNTGFEQIHKLIRLTDSTALYLQQGNTTGLRKALAKPEYALGEAQPFYNILLQNISAYLLEQGEHIYSKRATNLQQQLQRYQSVSTITGTETRLIDEELKQAAERFAANEKLYQDKVISRMEYYEEAAKMRQRKLSLEAQRRSNLQNNITINVQQKQLLEVQYDKAEKERVHYLAIEEAIRNLQNYIQGWKRQYLVIAPYKGTLHYLKPLQENETVNAGDELFAVIPAQYHYTAFINLPPNGLGKVQPGQKVHLLLNKYPYQEYGYIEGTVTHISELPVSDAKTDKDVTYRVAVGLPDSLITSYHKTIPFSPEMAATARIITQDRNLLQRLIAGITGWKK